MSGPTPHVPALHKSIVLSGRRTVTLVAELGRGASATVYRGILEADSFIRRPVAVKVYDLASNDEPEGALAALGRAAQRAAHIAHPNAVQTLELALVGRSHAAVLTELVVGTTLEHLVKTHAPREARGSRIPLDLALFVALEIAEALSGARVATTPDGVHAGMCHLDVSLHQVLLSFQGEVKLSDFGLSQVALWNSGVRVVEGVSQRWAAVAPEMAQGRTGDARSDVFSLGIIFREMLIGPRFGADVSDAQALEHTREGFVPPTFLELKLPAGVSMVLRRALEPDPARRYPNATAMAYELRRVALSMGVGDGRMFLRAALAEQAAMAPPAERVVESAVPDTTEDLALVVDEMDTPMLVEDRTSGLILKADRARKRGA
jgi:eukaryotic-like serine/threonine-protein kinase